MGISIRGGAINPTKPIKLSFFGPLGSGKSTASHFSRDIFRELLPLYWFKKCNVAEPLYLIQNYVYSTMGVQNPLQDSKFLKYIAKKFEDDLGPRCVRKARGVAYTYQGKVVCVNSDCRNNAYRSLKDDGFIFIKVRAKLSVRSGRIIERGDVTIAGIDQIKADYSISNNGSLSQFKISIEKVIKKIIPKL